MDITVEISMYPLIEVYEAPIIKFIKALQSNKGLEILTSPMSTYVIGESTAVFMAIDSAMKNALVEIDTTAFVMKVLNRRMPMADGFITL